MRSAAEGEHRTGEECLDGIARRRAILPERWAIGTRCHGAWSVAASKPGLRALPTFARECSQRRSLHLAVRLCRAAASRVAWRVTAAGRQSRRDQARERALGMGIPGPAQREAQPLPFLVFLVQPGRILSFHPEHITMGLNIIGDLVDVDHSHNQLLNTGRHGNPAVQQVALGQQELTVYSAFQRHKAPRSMGRDRKGDNCHLLYALKGKDGLRTSFGAIRRLMLHFDAILEDMVDQSGEYDLVVPMPSGHAISRQFGQRLADRYRCPVRGGLFSKISKTRARELLEQRRFAVAR